MAASPFHEAVVSLQRSAGNVAVSQLLVGGGSVLQRQAPTPPLAPPVKPAEAPPFAHGTDRPEYEAKLTEAVEKLAKIEFGRGEQATSEDFDHQFWEKEPDPDPDVAWHLRLKEKLSPADALDAIVDKPQKWSFDCAQYVQVSELYALRHTLGKAQFDQYMRSTGKDGQVVLRVHWSTGLKRKTLYKRKGPSEPFIEENTTVGPPYPWTEDELLKMVPVGSRVCFTNDKLPVNDAYHNENTVLLGPDRFGAHAGTGGKKIWSRAALEAELAAQLRTKGSPAAAERYYISEIEVYALGFLDKPNP
jgi:hypothetical protein